MVRRRAAVNWWNRRSLRTRLVVGFSLTTAMFVVLISIVVFQSMSAQLLAVVDAGLDDRMGELASRVGDEDFDLSGEDRITQLIGADGAVRSSSPQIGEATPLISEGTARGLRRNDPVRSTITVAGVDFAVRVRAERFESPDGPIIVVVGRSLEALETNRRRLLDLFLLSAPLLILIVNTLGWLLARRILQPVQGMADRARLLQPGSSETLEVGQSAGDDEFSSLASSFNELLGRIDRARQHERRFIADVSHELRTPLSILRVEIELTATAPDVDAETAASLQTALGEIDRMTSLITRLLQIARTEAGSVPLRCIPTDIDALVDGLLAALPIPDPERVTIERTGGAAVSVVVDPDIVTEVLINVLNNALRHASTHVVVHNSVQDADLVIEVSDDGEGFEHIARARAMQRFTTGSDVAIEEMSPRTGLGLSIVNALVNAHGGRFALSNGPHGGALATIRLPAFTE